MKEIDATWARHIIAGASPLVRRQLESAGHTLDKTATCCTQCGCSIDAAFTKALKPIPCGKVRARRDPRTIVPEPRREPDVFAALLTVYGQG